MKRQGHYCKVCGQYKANEKFSGKGHAAHICRACASLPADARAEQMALTRLESLPFRLSREQKDWLNKRCRDRRPAVREAAELQYGLRFGRQKVRESYDGI